jgi:hypothetical protein
LRPPSRSAQANVRFRGALPGSRAARVGLLQPKRLSDAVSAVTCSAPASRHFAPGQQRTIPGAIFKQNRGRYRARRFCCSSAARLHRRSRSPPDRWAVRPQRTNGIFLSSPFPCAMRCFRRTIPESTTVWRRICPFLRRALTDWCPGLAHLVQSACESAISPTVRIVCASGPVVDPNQAGRPIIGYTTMLSGMRGIIHRRDWECGG